MPVPPYYWGIGHAIERINADVHRLDVELAKKYGRVFGGYIFTIPTLNVVDVDLVKRILIKDFHHFVDRAQSNAYHELWNRNLFSASGDDWKVCSLLILIVANTVVTTLSLMIIILIFDFRLEPLSV